MDTAAFNHRFNFARETTEGAALPFLGLAVGAISFGPHWWTIGLSIVYPVLLYRAESRKCAFLVALLYHLGATRALGNAAGAFFGDKIFFGVLIWIIGNFVNALIFAALWNSRRSIRLYSVLFAAVLMAIPPLGVLGWANPLTAAGVFFPGAGVLGFAYLAGVYVCLALGSTRTLKIFGLISLWYILSTPMVPASPIKAISTDLGRTDDDGRGDYNRQIELKNKVLRVKEKIILLPEGVVSGGWTEAGERLWSHEKKTVLMGVEQRIERPENLVVTTNGLQTYAQRQPVPFSMWRPFDDGSFGSHWFEDPVLEVDGMKLAPVICYEGFLVWPIVHSNLMGAKYIVATGNYWWAKGSEIPAIHESIIRSWSRLFSMPYSVAVNT